MFVETEGSQGELWATEYIWGPTDHKKCSAFGNKVVTCS